MTEPKQQDFAERRDALRKEAMEKLRETPEEDMNLKDYAIRSLYTLWLEREVLELRKRAEKTIYEARCYHCGFSQLCVKVLRNVKE